jgi:UDP-N-acetyl-D-glucosamine dehydrogenase
MARNAEVVFHDPHVPVIPETREHPTLAGECSVALLPELIAECDAVLIATDHDAVDYALLDNHATLIVDSRNAMERHGLMSERVVKA